MRIHRHITTLAATAAAIGALAPVTGAFAAPNRAGSALKAPAAPHHVSAPLATCSTGTAVVPERVWQEINDALLTKLLNRS
jgi:hypothetical protein